MAPWPNDLSPSQYRDGSNLDARARLHALYGNVSWFSWVAERMAFDDDARVLDIGCGPGGFWAKASTILPGTLRLVLADRSPWMMSKALTQIDATGGFAHVAGCQADAAALPFPDASIDADTAARKKLTRLIDAVFAEGDGVFTVEKASGLLTARA